jgi:hypothetical protein
VKVKEKCVDCVLEEEEFPQDAFAKGRCSKHYQRNRHGYGGPRRKRKDTGVRKSEYRAVMCAAPDCGKRFERRASEVRGVVYCSRRCYEQFSIPGPGRRATVPIGARKILTSGYVDVYVGIEEAMRLDRREKGYVFEHRLVMSRHLGRPLLPHENVHHRSVGIEGRSDNRLSQLELWTTAQPAGQRPEDVVAYSREMLALYGTVEERERYG